MKVELKTWAGLGLATALAGAGLAGCSTEPAAEDEATQASQAGEMGEGEGGEGGEGGESGEGGVSAADAATDAVVYGSALAVAEAHAIAARDAYLIGKTDAAAEMFAHPVSEVLLEMDPVFAELGVEDFKDLFGDASAAILNGADEAAVTANYDAIIAALRSAAEKAPASEMSDALVSAGVAADQVERAVTMYGEATGSDRYEPYLDGYGFYKAAETAFSGSSSAIESENAELHTALTEALALLAAAYPSADRPEELTANQGQLIAAGSKIALAQ
ncbi:MAG: hypothetical protein AAF697_06550 [Pseudomonadota bacterium]